MKRNRIEEIVDIFGNFIEDKPKEPKAPEITKISEEADESKN